MRLKIKLFIIMLCGILFCGSLQAQKPFFGRLAKPTALLQSRSVIPGVPAPAPEENAFKPIVNVASYTSDNSLLTGTGISYGHFKWDETAGRWDAVWSANLLAWYKAPLGGSPNAFAYGFAVGVWNNRFLAGIARGGGKTFATVGIGINVNTN